MHFLLFSPVLLVPTLRCITANVTPDRVLYATVLMLVIFLFWNISWVVFRDGSVKIGLLKRAHLISTAKRVYTSSILEAELLEYGAKLFAWT